MLPRSTQASLSNWFLTLILRDSWVLTIHLLQFCLISGPYFVYYYCSVPFWHHYFIIYQIYSLSLPLGTSSLLLEYGFLGVNLWSIIHSHTTVLRLPLFRILHPCLLSCFVVRYLLIFSRILPYRIRGWTDGWQQTRVKHGILSVLKLSLEMGLNYK